jgi:hypothetical protein
MPGYPDWFGTPLVHGLNYVAGPNATQVIAHNGVFTFNALFSHPGYVVDIFATIASGAATVPFYEVEFRWMDSSAAATIDVERFYLAASSTGPWRTCGKGPTRGQLLQVTVTNLDPAFAITLNYSIAECTQHIARDDWRTVEYQAANVPQYGTFGNIPKGLAKGDLAAAVMMSETNDTIPAATSWAFLAPMYTGPVFWQFLSSANIAVSVRIPNELNAAPNLDGNAPIWLDLTLTDVTVQFSHPRIPLVVNLQNSSGAGIGGVSACGMIVENAS